MADYNVRTVAEYRLSAFGGSASLVRSYNIPGATLTDGEAGDDTFESGDQLFLQGLGFHGSYEGAVLVQGRLYVVFRDGSTLYLVGPVPTSSAAYPDDIDTNQLFPITFIVCFAAGTMIATPEGECAVETLAIGDPVLTVEGEVVPVKWIGRQTVSKLFTPAERFVPVRVKAEALGRGLPHSDLVLTGDHALAIDGLLINASALVNDDSIGWEAFDALPERVTYFHVETEKHEIILANGAAAETFVDHVTRRRFDNYADYAARYGDERTVPSSDRPRVSSARLLPAHIRALLARRAIA